MIGEGTVLNDFLELLLFGTPSDELQTFLLKDLTDRGMKKLGMSLQNYYKTIQELLIANMQRYYLRNRICSNIRQKVHIWKSSIALHISDVIVWLISLVKYYRQIQRIT